MKFISDLIKSSGLFAGPILVLIPMAIFVTDKPVSYEVIISLILGLWLTWYFGIRSFLKLGKREKKNVVLAVCLIILVLLVLLLFYLSVIKGNIHQ